MRLTTATHCCLTAFVMVLFAGCSDPHSQGDAEELGEVSSATTRHGDDDDDHHGRRGHHASDDDDRDGHRHDRGRHRGHKHGHGHEHGHGDRDHDCDSDQDSAFGRGECKAAANDRKVGICHATGDPSNPYVHVRVSVHGCSNGHRRHADDFLSNDPTCATSTCTPITCDSAEASCGVLPDGCDGEVDCGPCPMPNLVPTSLCGRTSASRGGSLLVDFSMLNDGTAQAPAGAGNDVDSWIGAYYLSTDPDITTGDLQVGSFMDQPALLPGESWASAQSILIPREVAAGTYYLGLILDPLNVLSESNEADNTIAYCGELLIR